MDERTLHQIIKRRLRRTWDPFFRRFRRLNPIQIQAIPVVLQRKNAILVSSTASGKTEAVLAPLCELILSERTTGIAILYLIPTRALANDLQDRLTDIFRELSLELDIKTGDSPNLRWNNPPDLLITTPESLDSILCRHQSVLGMVRSVVIDEIHFLDGTYRGDQVRFLLNRVRQLAPDFRTYALSATVADPAETAGRYMESAEVIQTPGTRDIRESYVMSLAEIAEIARKEKIGKILIFCNRKSHVESLADQAKSIWHESAVVAHHGSLGQRERTESESTMKHASRAICVATMTLEIGVDIGSIEAVVLADIPGTEEAFIQRIGRAGRRTGIIRVFLLCSDEDDRLAFGSMLEIIRASILQKKEYRFDISVVVQQIFSLLYAHPEGILEEDLVSFFQEMVSSDMVRLRIIPHLIEMEYLVSRREKVFASQKVMDLGERGTVHSNIPDKRGYHVINLDTNREVGEIDLPDDIMQRETSQFILAGRLWRVIRVAGSKVFVRPAPKANGPAQFVPSRSRGAFFGYLPPDLQEEIIKGPKPPK